MSEENVDCKPDILSNMSHEMRSALNIIMASCNMANKQLDNKSRVQEYLKKIYMTVDHLTKLIDDYLVMCRIEEGGYLLAEEGFSIDDLGEELESLMEPLAAEKNIGFDVAVGKFMSKDVMGDYDRILQMLINLTSNSIKYTPEGGKVFVCLEEAKGEETDGAEIACRFSCADNGIGMYEDFLCHIFEPFARADDDRVRLIKGTGLGMPIVKATVDAMGGSIHIDSMIDVGTTVTILIKLRKNIRKG